MRRSGSFEACQIIGRWAAGTLLFVTVLIAGGCQSPTSPADAPDEYDALVQRAVVQAEGRPDTSFFWLRNTGNAEARTLMLDLGVDYLRYDRSADVLCVWAGEGLWPARGYATAPASGALAADSIGVFCDVEGTCATEPATERWVQFRCN